MGARNAIHRDAFLLEKETTMSDEYKNPADMTDQELIAEWNCIDCDSEDTARTDALTAELQKRNLDF